MNPTIFQYVGGTITNAINAFVGPAAANLTTAMQGLLLLLVSMYIMVMGFAIIMGSVQSPISKFAVQSLKIIFITAFVLAGSVYGPLVVGSFEAFEVMLSSALNGAPAANIYQVIDNTLGQGMTLARECLMNAMTWNIGEAIAWLFPAFFIFAGTIAIVLLGGAAIIVAKFMLALLFALGPFFIAMLLFPATARFFDSWFSQAMNYTFVVVTVSVIMSFAMVTFSTFVLAADLSGEDISGAGAQNPLLVSAEVFILASIFAFIIQQSYGFSASLAGGLSMAVLTYAHIAAPGRLARNVADPVSNRRDLQSGMMTTSRRHEQMIAGNTPLNPAYNQYMRQSIGKNWGRAKGGNVKG